MGQPFFFIKRILNDFNLERNKKKHGVFLILTMVTEILILGETNVLDGIVSMHFIAI